jgi:putative DNA primase/helicase
MASDNIDLINILWAHRLFNVDPSEVGLKEKIDSDPEGAQETRKRFMPELLTWSETDYSNTLAGIQGQDICYCIDQGSFYFWDGQRYCKDDFRALEQFAEDTVNQITAAVERMPASKTRAAVLRKLRRARNRRHLQNMVHLAKKKVRAVSVNEFDADPWKLVCENGIVDLRTGLLCPHSRSVVVSKMIPVDYDPEATCPRFMTFLDRIMGGGPNAAPEAQDKSRVLIECLQRLFGCCATGVFEKVLVVMFGAGNNGKTTLMEVIRAALGGDQYAGEMQIGSLMVSNRVSDNAVSADIADLKGRRLITSSEPEEGHHLSVARVKYLTGGGQIKARYLRENPFTFSPTHKILIDTNHPPVITNANDAVWNRVKCIPFTVTIPRDEIDNDLPAKLRAELAGILAWIVRGAVKYAESGLHFPDIVNAVTEEYRNKCDQIPNFLADMCCQGNDKWVSVTRLRQSYESWAASCGEDKLSQSDFNSRLYQAGFKQDRRRVDKLQARGWSGLDLMPTSHCMSLKPSLAA